MENGFAQGKTKRKDLRCTVPTRQYRKLGGNACVDTCSLLPVCPHSAENKIRLDSPPPLTPIEPHEPHNIYNVIETNKESLGGWVEKYGHSLRQLDFQEHIAGMTKGP